MPTLFFLNERVRWFGSLTRFLRYRSVDFLGEGEKGGSWLKRVLNGMGDVECVGILRFAQDDGKNMQLQRQWQRMGHPAGWVERNGVVVRV